MPTGSIARPANAIRAATAAAEAASRHYRKLTMLTELKSPNRFTDVAPTDKPQGDRVEHANLERPGAQAHPRMRGNGDWAPYMQPAKAWRTH